MTSSPGRRRSAALALALPCVAGVAVYGELSAGALLGVGAAGVVVSAVVLARRAGQAAVPVGRSGLPWLGWLAAAAGWEIATLATGLPTLSDLADPVLAHPATRAAATVLWLAAGAWLATRPRHPRRPG